MVDFGSTMLAGLGSSAASTPGVALTLGAEYDETIVAAVVVGGGVLIAIVAITTGRIKSIVETRAREQTRREVAAYVAEGSMTPEEGERLLVAGTADA